MLDRRQFFKKLGIATTFALSPRGIATAAVPRRATLVKPKTTVYRSIGENPAENLRTVIALMGGIGKLIGRADIVMIKPNVQRWNQAAPNISSLSALVDLVMNRPGGFCGEVVIVENVHRGPKPWQHAGWKKSFVRNSNLAEIGNYNELCRSLKKRYEQRFCVRHLVNVDAGGRRVYGPWDGPGYVYCDGTGDIPLLQYDNGQNGDGFRSVIMTYPIIETDQGTLIDFKHGIWEKDAYIRRPIKFINLSALNHHSYYCGATSAVKNYLGISDLSGGPDPYNLGKLTPDHYNFHSFPFDKWAPGPVPGMIGAEIGVFLNAIRKADLNITTADWIGIVSRTDTPVARTRAVLASPDPVAIDFHAFKYILYPNSKLQFHDPENEESPVYAYLSACARLGGCVFDEGFVDIKSWDHDQRRPQRDDELIVKGDFEWGRDVKTLIKYFAFRTGLYKLMV